MTRTINIQPDPIAVAAHAERIFDEALQRGTRARRSEELRVPCDLLVSLNLLFSCTIGEEGADVDALRRVAERVNRAMEQLCGHRDRLQNEELEREGNDE